jgi:hypothetical protein
LRADVSVTRAYRSRRMPSPMPSENRGYRCRPDGRCGLNEADEATGEVRSDPEILIFRLRHGSSSDHQSRQDIDSKAFFKLAQSGDPEKVAVHARSVTRGVEASLIGSVSREADNPNQIDALREPV